MSNTSGPERERFIDMAKRALSKVKNARIYAFDDNHWAALGAFDKAFVQRRDTSRYPTKTRRRTYGKQVWLARLSGNHVT
jgi:hypothetical protein